MISREALELVKELAEKAQAVEDLGLSPDGRERLYRVGDELVPRLAAPPSRDHRVWTLSDLIRFANDYANSKSVSGPGGLVFWHCRTCVVLVLDDADRRDKMTFQLTYWSAFYTLVQLSASVVRYSQRDFVRLLQVHLGVDRAIMTPFRKLDWNQQIHATGEVTPGRERLGKDVASQVAGTSGLPEDILMSTPVYAEQGERETVQVRCLIDTFPAEEKLALIPLPGEVEAAIDAAQASIHERLIKALGSDARVYYGSP